MITVLNIQESLPSGMIEKIKSFMVPYSIDTSFCSGKMANIFMINYTRRKGKIRFDKIYKSCIGKPKTVLCNENILPDNIPFKRFSDTEFQTIMMKNMVIDLLKRTGQTDLKITFYDPFAEYPSFIPELLKYVTVLTVISNMPRFYENEAERIMSETGASIIVKNDIEQLLPTDILIATVPIDKEINVGNNELIFTVQKPLAACRGNIFYDYKLYIPSEIICKIPDSIDESYFAGALFLLCNIKELKKITPYACRYGQKLIGTDEICNILKKVIS